jgi:hypothetical protein
MDGNDRVFGGTGDDTLRGAAHSDIVRGEVGNDTIDLAALDTPNTIDQGYDGDGDDTFLAADGNRGDVMDGGPGIDTFFAQDNALDVIYCEPSDNVAKHDAGLDPTIGC